MRPIRLTAMAALLAVCATAQQTPITGTMVGPTGDPVTVSCDIQAVSSFSTPGGLRVVRGPKVTVTFVAGVVSVSLLPTDSGVPSPQYYTADCSSLLQTVNGRRILPYTWPQKKWQVPTSVTPVDIGVIETSDPSPAISAYIDWRLIPNPSTNPATGFLRRWADSTTGSPCWKANDGVQNCALSAIGSYSLTGRWNFSAGKWRPPAATFAAPPSSPQTGDVYLFSDASAPGVCTGGGSSFAQCRRNGSSGWDAIGGGAGIWGLITGSIADQADLAAALGLKAPLASPVFTGQPTIPNFTLAGHTHQNTAGGGTLDAAAIASGAFPKARQHAATVYSDASYSNPAWISSIDWSKITGAPSSNCSAVTVTFSATPTFDLSKCRSEITLTGNVTSVTFTNATPGTLLAIAYTQDGTAGRSVAYGSSASNTCAVDPTSGITTTQILSVRTDSSIVGVFCGTNVSFVKWSGPTGSTPAPPATGSTCWADSTSSTLHCIDPSSAVTTMVLTQSSATANTFIDYIPATGIPHRSAVDTNSIMRATHCADTSGSANAITCTTTTTFPGAYAAGQSLLVKVAVTNTGATTININSLGNKNVTTQALAALSSGTLTAGGEYLLTYDGTQFQVVGAGGGGGGGGGSFYQTVQDHGVALPQEPTINFRDKLSGSTVGGVTTVDYEPRGVRSVVLTDEFGSGLNTTGNVGNTAWNFDIIGGSGTVGASLAAAWPNLGLTRSGCATGNATCGIAMHHGGTVTPTNSYGSLAANVPWGVTIVFRLQQTTNTRFRAGFANVCNAAAPSNGWFLRYDTNLGDTTWRYENRATASPTTYDTTISPDTSFHTMEIYSTVAGTIHFTIDGGTDKTLCASGGGCDISATPSALAMDDCLVITTDTSTGAAQAEWDFWGFTARVSTGSINKRN